MCVPCAKLDVCHSRLQAPVEVREQMSQHSTKRRSVNDLHKEHGKPAIQEATKQPNATPGQVSRLPNYSEWTPM